MLFDNDSDVTVVISTYNRCKFLQEAIQSILSQTVIPSRVIIVDDGSTDDTKSVIEQFGGGVECVVLRNGGKAKALNFVLPLIKTKYVWFFDDDDAAYPDALENLLSKIVCGDQFGFVFGSYDVVKTDGGLLASEARSVPYGYETEPIMDQRLRLFRDCTVMMSGALLRTNLVKLIGGFNEELIRCQDYDLMVRLAAISDFSYCGKSVYMWREHEGLRGTKNNSHSDESRVKVWAKFNEPIGRFLRYRVPINMFSGNDKLFDVPDSIREALINRAWVCAPKLPLHYAVSDLREAFRTPENRSLRATELEKLEGVFHHDFVSFRNTIDLIGLLPLCFRFQGCVALNHITKGIYWIGQSNSSILTRSRFTLVSWFLALAAVMCKIVLHRNRSAL